MRALARLITLALLALPEFPLSAEAQPPRAGEPTHLEPVLAARSDILFYSGFETDPWSKVWGLAWGPSPENNLSLVADRTAYRGRSIRIRYPKGLIGGDSACEFFSAFSKLGIAPRTDLYVRYLLRFDPGFEFVKGGKLPGLVGGEANTGGHIPNGRDGWSARIMWRPGGRIVQYVYHPDQPGVWGEDYDWNLGGHSRFFKPGVWHCVETHVRMNTPGKRDGWVESWLDGEKALEARDLRFRDVAELKIDAFYFSTFFGGGDPSWAPPSDQYVQFDEFVIAENPIGPPGGFRGAPVSGRLLP